MTSDEIPSLRIAAHLALWRISQDEKHMQGLLDEIDNPNLVVGLYAINAIEQTEAINEQICIAAERASQSAYEFTRRCGKRLLTKCEKINNSKG